MPSTIPYDPSLVLGNIVSQDKLDLLVNISTAQAPADAAEDTLNSLIALKRSLDMTVQELIEMNIDATDLIAASEDTGKQITAAGADYAKAKLASEKAIQPLKAQIRGISDSIESPIDYNKSALKSMPLAADSLKMNCQYFSFDQNEQDSSTHAATVASFVNDSVSEGFGSFSGSYADQDKGSAQSQVNSQHQRHDIAGTLVISIVCTHKDALLFAPFIMDIDKAVRVWNNLFPDDMIKTNSLSSITQILAQQDTKDEKFFQILSGETCGSCFIGMVHVLNTSETQSSETLYSVAESLQSQFQIGLMFSQESGGFGLDSSFSADAKNLLSSQSITSHCSLTVMGSIPSIKSNTVLQSVMAIQDFDGASSMKAVQQIQNATAGDMATIDKSADDARTGGQMIAMQTAKVSAALSSLSAIDNNNNKIIDTNSMMDAMEDYIDKCLKGNIGLPINYYLKPITKSQIAHMWLAKYYPSKLSMIDSGGDDSAPASGGSSAPAADNSSGGGATS